LISSLIQNYSAQQLAMAQYDKTPLQKEAAAPSSSSNASSDSVEISTAAKQALNDSIQLQNLSDRAYKLLKVRNISDDEIIAFQEILSNAESADNAKDFLKSLSHQDLELVKKANSYGVTLNYSHIDGMSEEGARNMLVQPDYRFSVDYNNDGIVEHGQARTFQFPPPNAPEEVKDAWDKTMASLPDKERLMASSVFMVKSLTANIHSNGNGTSVTISHPGDDDYINISSTDKSDWKTLLREVSEYLDFIKTYYPNSNPDIERNMAMIDTFTDNLFG
jgi:hypothetical protein